jgi:hypothetical protein
MSLHRTQEVGGSSPPSSTRMKPLLSRGFRRSGGRPESPRVPLRFRHQCLYSEICDWFAGGLPAIRAPCVRPPGPSRSGPVTAASTGSVGLVKVPWDDGRCIFCAATGPVTDGHVIPRAAGGRLSAPFECARCNGLLGSSVEARLVSDPPCARLWRRSLTGSVRWAPVCASATSTPTTPWWVRAVGEGSDFRLRDTQQPDRSLVEDRARARGRGQDAGTPRRRRGRDRGGA